MKRLILAAFAVVPLACAGQVSELKRPDWVDNGMSEPNVLFAVGAKSGIKSKALLQKAAANQARAEMAATFSTYTAALMKDYSASISEGNSDPAEEQLVESVVKTFSSGYLSGVQVIKTWTDPTDGTMYALARLELVGFMDKLARAKQLSEAVKNRVRRSAERAVADLEREEEKHNARQ